MTQEQAIFLVEKFEKQALGRILKGEVLEYYYKAEMILRGWDRKKPRSCTCEYKNMARIVASLYDQHKTEAHRLYEEAKMVRQSGTSITTDLSGSTG